MIKLYLTTKLKEALTSLEITENFTLERPNNMEHGDFSTTIALKLAKKMKKNPMEIAEKIAAAIKTDAVIDKVEVLKPGFVNIWISKNSLIDEGIKIAECKINIQPHHLGDEKRIMIEYAHPNPFKLVHIGHLRNITTGEAIARLMQAVGNEIIRVNYQGDVGLHIAKCLYRIKQLYTKEGPEKYRSMSLEEKIKFLGSSYAEGNNQYEDNDEAKKAIIEINRKIYEKDPEIMTLWNEGRQWSLDYFHVFYKRVDTKFQREYFESECADRGLEISKQALEDGILEKSDGAVIFNGKKYGLDTRVFVNNNGFPTYEGKELGLAEKEFADFGDFDKCFHVVASEQTSFFKITFKVEELIDPKKYTGKQFHLIYGFVRLKTGKMSSREGNIIEANWLLDEAKKRLVENFKCDEKTAETLAVAAVKYSFLKHELKNEISFDFDESISLSGNSAIYLIYTYVRCLSILKNNIQTGDVIKDGYSTSRLHKEEVHILRMLEQYPETVHTAASTYAPQLIATYLFQLCQKYNLFYQTLPILKADAGEKNIRILITKAVSEVIKNSLFLLGINTVEKM